MVRARAEENNGFGPISERRSCTPTWACLGLIVLLFLGAALSTVKNSSAESPWREVSKMYVFAFAVSLLAYLSGEILRRVCLFVEECRHRDTRYKGSWKKAMAATFTFGKYTLLVLVLFVVFAVIVVISYDSKNVLCQNELNLFAVTAFFTPLVVHLLGLRELSKVEESELNEKDNKNVADGLAWSYYYGYLKFVLPELENQIHSTTEYRYKERFPHKVFIIIPKNCYCYDTINNEQSDPRKRVHIDGPLKPLEKNRGGVLKRIYKHTVYRIEANGEDPWYCIMEYATPLMTLYDMSEEGDAGLSREERDQQCVIFMRKLKEILDNDRDCQGKYELITLSGQDKDISEIMLQSLKNSVMDVQQ